MPTSPLARTVMFEKYLGAPRSATMEATGEAPETSTDQSSPEVDMIRNVSTPYMTAGRLLAERKGRSP